MSSSVEVKPGPELLRTQYLAEYFSCIHMHNDTNCKSNLQLFADD